VQLFDKNIVLSQLLFILTEYPLVLITLFLIMILLELFRMLIPLFPGSCGSGEIVFPIISPVLLLSRTQMPEPLRIPIYLVLIDRSSKNELQLQQ